MMNKLMIFVKNSSLELKKQNLYGPKAKFNEIQSSRENLIQTFGKIQRMYIPNL